MRHVLLSLFIEILYKSLTRLYNVVYFVILYYIYLHQTDYIKSRVWRELTLTFSRFVYDRLCFDVSCIECKVFHFKLIVFWAFSALFDKNSTKFPSVSFKV